MNQMFPYERRMDETVREVRDSSLLDVLDEQRGPGGAGGPEPAELFESLAQDGYPLAPRLQETHIPYRNRGLHWRAADPATTLVGEFDVMSVVASSDRWLDVDDFLREESDRELLEDLRILDDISLGGEGRIAAMRYQRGVANPEIWFLDRYHGYVRLDLDYRDYLDNLFITKGVTGWQYLFADVRLGEREFGYILENLRTMLRLFPGEFPAHDYAPLAARLEARL